MGLRTVHCSAKHTPLSPAKNRIRRDWMLGVPIDKDIITISHGLFDTAMTLQWRGRIQPCDIDPGVREAIGYMRRGVGGRPGDYPELNILPSGHSIEETVEDYVASYGVENLGAVDVDLAVTIKPSCLILQPVLRTLHGAGYRGKTFLTFRNGRDGLKNIMSRLVWLQTHLPSSVEMVGSTFYESTRWSDRCRRGKGSSMCIVELQHS